MDAARAIVTLDAARAYGLVRGGAEVDLERCLWILERGEELGYVPSSVAVHTAMIEYLGMEYRGPTP
ncbi:hypothetical protein GBA65_21965 (plasmid) [Rubrobacter marinus]|uniref:Uncharacterized protein n=1 Tax=Rubrobacter marinus TaxID=2653852 RepID=A0A6G8Q3S6_9ACTN|nr:hypothetical protein [Rubrobacter marinus]QIN81103.1 hypothetical protein GBA65_21965 [Rubrobacter marinus]